MKKETYAMYGDILREELLLAMGCTEPVAVAYAGAIARSVLDKPQSIRKCELYVSGNIIKNVKSVIVPNTDGMKGLETAGTSAERGTRSTGAGDTLPTGGGNRTCQQRTTKFSSEDTGAQAPPLGGGHGTVEGIGGQPVPRPHCKKWFHHAVRVARRSRGFYVPMGHYFPELSGCFNQ